MNEASPIHARGGVALEACRGCGSRDLHPVLDLGVMPSANTYRRPDETRPEVRFPLRTVVCGDCHLMQVDFDVAPDDLFSDYAYFSSYATSWVEHARRFCDHAIGRLGLNAGSLVVEVASNDGYLLQHLVAAGIPVLGIEPAANVAEVAVAKGVPTEARFFGRAIAAELVARGRRADLIVGNNVLAHVPDLADFVGGLALLVKPDGLISLEFPHLLNLIAEVQFDTIYHEHFSYFSLHAVERVLAAQRLVVVDLDRLPTHGGSLRLWVAPAAAARVPTPAVAALAAEERAAGLDGLARFAGFAATVGECRRSFRAFLADARVAGRRVAGYGAAAKGNTLLNYCGVTAADLIAVADRNPHKQGTLLPGSGVPVVAPERLLEIKPDYLLILPWNLKDEIMEQMAAIRGWGGRFVTPVPTTVVHP